MSTDLFGEPIRPETKQREPFPGAEPKRQRQLWTGLGLCAGQLDFLEEGAETIDTSDTKTTDPT